MKGINRITNPEFSEFGNTIIYGYYLPNNWALTYSSDTPMALYDTTSHAYTYDRAVIYAKQGNGNSSLLQTINFGYDISGLTFDMGAWVKVTGQTGDGGVKVSYQWLDSSGTIIGSEVTISTITAVQSYTLCSTSAATAPSNAQRIKFIVGTTGTGQPTTVWFDSCYVYGGTSYGLKIYNTSGDSNTVLPEASSIIASGTVSMPNTLQDDKTYGVDIDLPGDEYIDIDKIGVMVQARDFDWKALVNILPYDSGNSFWGNFFGDSAVTYYEKASDGVMSTWTAGAMTPGTQSTYTRLLSLSPYSSWETNSTSVKKIKLFAGIDYNFLKTIAGGSTTYTLYGRDYGKSTLGAAGYMSSTEQGSTLKSQSVTSDYGARWFDNLSAHSHVFVLHSDGSATEIGSGVATYNKTDIMGNGTAQGSATWSCPLTALVSTDAIVVRVDVSCTFRYNDWFPNYKSFSTTYITNQLNWTQINASTWTIYYYMFWSSQVSERYSNAGMSWGTSAQEVKFTNISTGYSASTEQQVYSIGDNGISEVDYMIYLKDYNGS